MLDNLPPCPKCRNDLILIDVLVTEDDTLPALTCIDEQCSFLVCETINEFLFDEDERYEQGHGGTRK